jgi:hypothetical protein
VIQVKSMFGFAARTSGAAPVALDNDQVAIPASS